MKEHIEIVNLFKVIHCDLMERSYSMKLYFTKIDLKEMGLNIKCTLNFIAIKV